jgi:hypothetical protein
MLIICCLEAEEGKSRFVFVMVLVGDFPFLSLDNTNRPLGWSKDRDFDDCSEAECKTQRKKKGRDSDTDRMERDESVPRMAYIKWTFWSIKVHAGDRSPGCRSVPGE